MKGTWGLPLVRASDSCRANGGAKWACNERKKLLESPLLDVEGGPASVQPALFDEACREGLMYRLRLPCIVARLRA